MGETFRQSFRARWADMDFNQHMRNAAYLGCAEDTRMRYLDTHGWTMAEFQRRQLGPVVVEDKLTYRRELQLLEPFAVDLQLGASTEDGRRMRLRNRFFLESDGTLCATVESVVLWFDIGRRAAVAPPDLLRERMLALERTEGFEWYPQSSRKDG